MAKKEILPTAATEHLQTEKVLPMIQPVGLLEAEAEQREAQAEAEAEQREKNYAEIAKTLQHVVIMPDAQRPKSGLIWLWDDAEIALGRMGAVITIAGDQGSGKSAVSAALACSTLGALDRDYKGKHTMGFCTPCVGCLYIDTEQDSEEFPYYWGRVFQGRVVEGMGKTWEQATKHVRVHSFLMEEADLRKKNLTKPEMFEVYLRRAELLAEELGGPVMVIFDKLDSFMDSVNDEQQASTYAYRAMQWGAKTRNLFVTTQHNNRVGAARGWNGTILLDKANGALAVEVKDGIRWLTCTKARYGRKEAIKVALNHNGRYIDACEVPKIVTQTTDFIGRLEKAFTSQWFSVKQAEAVLTFSREKTRNELESLTMLGLLEKQGTGARKKAYYRVFCASESDPVLPLESGNS